MSSHSFYEFFAGGGMARAGLGQQWKCLFANDSDFKKSAIYNENWGNGALITKDIMTVKPEELPDFASLAWASFPCQDLSLAGMGAGLRGDRSGTFWPFWNLIKDLKKEQREPLIVVLENVCGTLTSHQGKDFAAIAEALTESNFRFGAVIINASEFLPHSRPRLFIIAVSKSVTLPKDILLQEPFAPRHTKMLITAYKKLSQKAKGDWIWWNIPLPPKRTTKFADLLEPNPDIKWHSNDETEKLLKMMSPRNKEKVEEAKKTNSFLVGTIYKRTRHDENGVKIQRAEIRFDNLAGCLRTSSGGSSRQVILIVNGDKIQSRLISIRETARLMGLPENYKLPLNYNEGYHLTGDGVAVPVVRHIANTILEPILSMA